VKHGAACRVGRELLKPDITSNEVRRGFLQRVSNGQNAAPETAATRSQRGLPVKGWKCQFLLKIQVLMSLSPKVARCLSEA
jgi:hypothetical protein